ncbi:MAG: RlmE family RNA methyltransferase [Nitrososphaeria archaeon]|nr:RlmE family RNA methyltransferase [Nitrososphaeria archaeon]
MKLSQARRDFYRRKAKEEGYKSRAAYKLIELVKKYGLIRAGDYVIDFGCAPGGWLQVASKYVGLEGKVFGFDIKAVKIGLPNVFTYILDISSPDALDVVKRCVLGEVNVVLSDLSPNISGVWEVDHAKQIDLTLKVIEMFPNILKQGGNCLLKVFQGPYLDLVRNRLKSIFDEVYLTKPSASRKESSELYFVCLSYLG